jgi:hypothetical protein
MRGGDVHDQESSDVPVDSRHLIGALVGAHLCDISAADFERAPYLRRMVKILRHSRHTAGHICSIPQHVRSIPRHRSAMSQECSRYVARHVRGMD